MTPHVVIVGGGFGGLSAAKALRKAPVRVTVVDRHNHHLFQPLLYQVATATLSPGDIASPIRWILRHARNTRVLLGDVRTIDLANRRLVLEDGASIDYDYLIMTGWSARSSCPWRMRWRSGGASSSPSSRRSARRIRCGNSGC